MIANLRDFSAMMNPDIEVGVGALALSEGRVVDRQLHDDGRP
jgi:hypothetical protein